VTVRPGLRSTGSPEAGVPVSVGTVTRTGTVRVSGALSAVGKAVQSDWHESCRAGHYRPAAGGPRVQPEPARAAGGPSPLSEPTGPGRARAAGPRRRPARSGRRRAAQTERQAHVAARARSTGTCRPGPRFRLCLPGPRDCGDHPSRCSPASVFIMARMAAGALAPPPAAEAAALRQRRRGSGSETAGRPGRPPAGWQVRPDRGCPGPAALVPGADASG
jgi:hypothetical protein